MILLFPHDPAIFGGKVYPDHDPGACAIGLWASAPARIVAENSVRSIFSPS
jgi:hypothetical protein